MSAPCAWILCSATNFPVKFLTHATSQASSMSARLQRLVELEGPPKGRVLGEQKGSIGRKPVDGEHYGNASDLIDSGTKNVTNGADKNIPSFSALHEEPH